MSTIDLNCDLGEGGGHDAELMPLITSANIACGGHAGDRDTMQTCVELARRHGVAIGGHPGHPDRAHVGRLAVPITPAAAARLVIEQLAALAAVAGSDLVHVKLHGGLYHQVATDAGLAAAVVAALAAEWPQLVVFAPAGSLLVPAARAGGLAVAAEAFADRRYGDDGLLVPRSHADALCGDPQEAATQAVLIARHHHVRTIGGRQLDLRADTLCLHGDGPDPVGSAHAIRRALAAVGVGLKAVSAGD